MKPRTTVPWNSIASLILAAAAVANPLDLIPMVAAIDDMLVAPALLVVAYLQYRKFKERQKAEIIDVVAR